MVTAFFFGNRTLLLDTCCNFGVSNLRCLLHSVSKAKGRPSNTLGGSYHPPYVADSHYFGKISYDPNLPFTVLSYHQQSSICYVRPKDKGGRKFIAPSDNKTNVQYLCIVKISLCSRNERIVFISISLDLNAQNDCDTTHIRSVK